MSPTLVATAALVGVFVLLQLLVPLLALGEHRPARMGWQMYSVAQPGPRAWFVESDGSLRELNLTGRFAVQRAEIDDTPAFARQVCALGQAQRVVVELQPGQRTTASCP